MVETQLDSVRLDQFKKLVIMRNKEIMLREQAYKNVLEGLYIEAKLFKQNMTTQWENYITFARGEHWPKRRPKHRVSAVINFTLENIERKAALLTDAKPVPRIKAHDDSLQDTADILNTLLGGIFESSQLGQAHEDLLHHLQVMGSGFLGSPYDATADYGRGGVVIPAYDPRMTFFDPIVVKSYALDQAEYVILEDVWPLSKAKDIFPKRADLYEAQTGLLNLEQGSQRGWIQRLRDRFVRPSTAVTIVDAIPRVQVREFYLRDRSRTERGGYEFDNACRKTVMIGTCVADDDSNPYMDGEFPVDMMSWHKDFDTAWGWGDVELGKNPQEMINKLTASMVENAMLMSNAIWVGDATALKKEDWEKLSNQPGAHVKKQPGRELRREQGEGLPESILALTNQLGVAHEKVLGMVDVMRGIRTGQVSSGTGIESLQMMAQALIRLRARSLEALNERVGRKLVSRIFQYYKPEKIAAAVKARKRSEGAVSELASELLKPISQRKLQKWTNLAFSIEPGSSLGLAKQQRRAEAFKLYEGKAIDRRALLTDLEYPHREKVLKRMEEAEADAVEREKRTQVEGGRSTRFPAQAGGSPAGRFQ